MTDQRADEGLARVLSGISHIPCGVCRSCVGIREDAACYQGMPDYAALATAARRYLLGRLPGREEIARHVEASDDEWRRAYFAKYPVSEGTLGPLDMAAYRLTQADAILALITKRLGAP